MSKIVIIGAGAMGSAFALPCLDNNHDINIVGTHLENEFIDQINKNNNFHPGLNSEIPKKIKIHKNIFLKKELLRPTKIYVKEILSLINKNLINGCANITGGGLPENIKRVIPKNYCADIDLNKIKPLKIFKWLKNNNIEDKEMLKTFNCGVGFCLIINPKKLSKVKKYFTNRFKPYVIGKISKGKNKVKLNGNINWI